MPYACAHVCAPTDAAEGHVQTDRLGKESVSASVQITDHNFAPRDLQVLGTLHEAFALLAFVCL